MDILKEIGDRRLYTLHSHTQFCDGRAQMEAFARAALEAGFTHYGFTPHSPVPIYSPCNMPMDRVADYLAEADRIKRTYGHRCRFYTGMEVDYLGPQWGPANPYFASLNLDYTIGSVHFIPSQSGEPVDIDGRFERFARNMSEHFNGDIEYVVRTFYAQSLDMLHAGGFDILGHFDKIAQNAALYTPGIEDTPWYGQIIETYIDAIIESGVTVEINTKAYADKGRFFPHRRYFRRLVDARVPLVVNSDAHVPALINASRAEAYAILEQ